MSRLYYITDVAEIPLDAEGYEMYSEIKEYNLPHHEMIAKEMCNSWNAMHIEKFFTGVLKGNIASAKMTCKKENGKTVAKVTVIGVSNFRFSEKRRNLVFEQLSAQMSDGWGEGFFHREFEDEKGKKFTVI